MARFPLGLGGCEGPGEGDWMDGQPAPYSNARNTYASMMGSRA